MVSVLVPIFVCVVLPVAIVLIVSLTEINKEKQRAEIIKKAMECNNSINTEKLIESFRKPRRSAREILYRRLLLGLIFSLIGIGLLIIGLVSFCMGTEFGADPVTVPLVFGFISFAIGASFLIVYYVSKKQIINPEEKTER